MAQYSKLPELMECCENILRKEDYFNDKICAFAKEKKNKLAVDLFVNKPLLADVTFVVEGTRVFGHKAVLMARSDVLAAMLGGGFRESSTREVVNSPEINTDFYTGFLYTLVTSGLHLNGSPAESDPPDKIFNYIIYL
jgi:Rho family protein